MPTLRLPNGQDLQYPEGASVEKVREVARRKYPHAFEADTSQAQSGFFPSIQSGLRDLTANVGIAAAAPFNEGAARMMHDRAEYKNQQEYKPAAYDDAKTAFNSGDVGGALTGLLGYWRDQIGSSLPQMGTYIAGQSLGAMAGRTLGGMAGGAAFGPVGALVGGGLGAMAAGIPQFIGSNLSRQMDEDKTGKAPLNVGAAAMASVPQAGMDAVETVFLLGRLGLGKGTIDALIRKPADVVEKELVRKAQESLLATTAKGVATGIAAEVPTEVAQQILERAQAGLSLTDAGARKEYEETAVGVMGPGALFGGVGRFVDRSSARDSLVGMENKKAADAKAAADAQLEKQKQDPAWVTQQLASLDAQRADIISELNDYKELMRREPDESTAAQINEKRSAAQQKLTQLYREMSALNPEAAKRVPGAAPTPAPQEETGLSGTPEDLRAQLAAERQQQQDPQWRMTRAQELITQHQALLARAAALKEENKTADQWQKAANEKELKAIYDQARPLRKELAGSLQAEASRITRAAAREEQFKQVQGAPVDEFGNAAPQKNAPFGLNPDADAGAYDTYAQDAQQQIQQENARKEQQELELAALRDKEQRAQAARVAAQKAADEEAHLNALMGEEAPAATGRNETHDFSQLYQQDMSELEKKRVREEQDTVAARTFAQRMSGGTPSVEEPRIEGPGYSAAQPTPTRIRKEARLPIHDDIDAGRVTPEVARFLGLPLAPRQEPLEDNEGFPQRQGLRGAPAAAYDLTDAADAEQAVPAIDKRISDVGAALATAHENADVTPLYTPQGNPTAAGKEYLRLEQQLDELRRLKKAASDARVRESAPDFGAASKELRDLRKEVDHQLERELFEPVERLRTSETEEAGENRDILKLRTGLMRIAKNAIDEIVPKVVRMAELERGMAGRGSLNARGRKHVAVTAREAMKSVLASTADPIAKNKQMAGRLSKVVGEMDESVSGPLKYAVSLFEQNRATSELTAAAEGVIKAANPLIHERYELDKELKKERSDDLIDDIADVTAEINAVDTRALKAAAAQAAEKISFAALIADIEGKLKQARAAGDTNDSPYMQKLLSTLKTLEKAQHKPALITPEIRAAAAHAVAKNNFSALIADTDEKLQQAKDAGIATDSSYVQKLLRKSVNLHKAQRNTAIFERGVSDAEKKQTRSSLEAAVASGAEFGAPARVKGPFGLGPMSEKWAASDERAARGDTEASLGEGPTLSSMRERIRKMQDIGATRRQAGALLSQTGTGPRARAQHYSDAKRATQILAKLSAEEKKLFRAAGAGQLPKLRAYVTDKIDSALARPAVSPEARKALESARDWLAQGRGTRGTPGHGTLKGKISDEAKGVITTANDLADDIYFGRQGDPAAVEDALAFERSTLDEGAQQDLFPDQATAVTTETPEKFRALQARLATMSNRSLQLAVDTVRSSEEIQNALKKISAALNKSRAAWNTAEQQVAGLTQRISEAPEGSPVLSGIPEVKKAMEQVRWQLGEAGVLEESGEFRGRVIAELEGFLEKAKRAIAAEQYGEAGNELAAMEQQLNAVMRALKYGHGYLIAMPSMMEEPGKTHLLIAPVAHEMLAQSRKMGRAVDKMVAARMRMEEAQRRHDEGRMGAAYDAKRDEIRRNKAAEAARLEEAKQKVKRTAADVRTVTPVETVADEMTQLTLERTALSKTIREVDKAGENSLFLRRERDVARHDLDAARQRAKRAAAKGAIPVSKEEYRSRVKVTEDPYLSEEEQKDAKRAAAREERLARVASYATGKMRVLERRVRVLTRNIVAIILGGQAGYARAAALAHRDARAHFGEAGVSEKSEEYAEQFTKALPGHLEQMLKDRHNSKSPYAPSEADRKELRKLRAERTTKMNEMVELAASAMEAGATLKRMSFEDLDTFVSELGKYMQMAPAEQQGTLSAELGAMKGQADAMRTMVQVGQAKGPRKTPERMELSGEQARATGVTAGRQRDKETIQRRQADADLLALRTPKTGTILAYAEKAPAKPLDAAAAVEVIEAVKANLPDGVRFVYAPTLSEAPAELQEEAEKAGVSVKGAVMKDGTIVVIGDMHSSVRDLEETIAHELIGHYGVESVLGEDGMKALAGRVFNNGEKGALELAREMGVAPQVLVAIQVAKASQTDVPLAVTKELVAHVAEQQPTPRELGGFKKFVKMLAGAVKSSMQQLGFTKVPSSTAQEIYDVIKVAREKYSGNQLGAKLDRRGNVSFRVQAVYSGVPQEIQNTLEGAIGGSKRTWDKIKANAVGMAFQTQFMDAYAGLEHIAKSMKDSLAGVQMMSWLRQYGQRNNMMAQVISHGAPSVEGEKQADGRTNYMLKSRIAEKGQAERPSPARVVQILSKLKRGNSEAANKLFTMYITSPRAKRVGIEKLNFGDEYTAEKLAAFDRWIAQPDQADARKVLEEARVEYNKFNKGMINFLVQSGAITPEEGARLNAHDDYIPWYRVHDGVASMFIGGERPMRVGNLKSQPYLQQLLGDDEKIQDFFTSSLQNVAMLLDMGMRNLATKSVAYTLRDAGVLDTLYTNAKTGEQVMIRANTGPANRNVIRFKEHGKDMHAVIGEDAFGIDGELVVKGLEGIAYTVPGIVRMMQPFSTLLRKGVTRNPMYAVRQVLKDPLANFFVGGVDGKPVVDTLRTLKDMYAGLSKEERELAASGVLGGQVLSGTKEDMRSIYNQIVNGDAGFFSKTMTALDKLAIKGDAASRVTAYNSLRRQGLSDMEAQVRTMDMMNYNKRGISPSINLLSATIPFMNAQIQSLDVLFKAMTGKASAEDKLKIKKKLYTRGLMMAATTLGYAALMDDDEAYKNADAGTKYLYWFIRIPGLDEPIKVPVPFEIGYIFKGLPELMYNSMFKNETGRNIRVALQSMLMNSVPGGIIPQALKPAGEVLVNKSLYNGQPIEGADVERLMKQDRYRSNTTELAKLIGKASGLIGDNTGLPSLSPLQIDYMMRGYTGGLGTALASLANPILRSSVAGPVEGQAHEMPLVGQLFQANDALGIVNDTYDLMKQFTEKQQSFKRALDEGRKGDAQELAAKYGKQIAGASMAGAYTQRMGEFTKIERVIRSAPEVQMSPREKREKLAQIRQAKIQLSAQFREAAGVFQ